MMNCIRKHISVLLLLGFLFPQGVNAIHHFVVPHAYSFGDTKAEFSKPAYEYHSCDYHYSGVKTLLPNLDYSLRKMFMEPEKENLIPDPSVFPDKIAFNYSVRGPPE